MTAEAPAKTLIVDGDGHVMEPGETLRVDRISRKVIEDDVYEIHDAHGLPL